MGLFDNNLLPRMERILNGNRKEEVSLPVLNRKVQDYDIFTLLSKGNGADSAALIWMAMEMGFNIAVTGDGQGIKMVLPAFSSIMQPYHKGLVVASECNDDWFSSNPNLTCTESLDSKTAADVIIVEHPKEKSAANAFLSVLKGSSFVISIPEKVIEGVVETLTHKPHEVDKSLIQLLDIAVQVDKHGIIEDMAEFRWHSRAERGCYVGQPYSTLRLIRDCITDYNALKESKLIRRYAQKNLIGLEESMAELKKRSAFLTSLRKENIEPWEITRQFLLCSCRAAPQKLK